MTTQLRELAPYADLVTTKTSTPSHGHLLTGPRARAWGTPPSHCTGWALLPPPWHQGQTLLSTSQQLRGALNKKYFTLLYKYQIQLHPTDKNINSRIGLELSSKVPFYISNITTAAAAAALTKKYKEVQHSQK